LVQDVQTLLYVFSWPHKSYHFNKNINFNKNKLSHFIFFEETNKFLLYKSFSYIAPLLFINIFFYSCNFFFLILFMKWTFTNFCIIEISFCIIKISFCLSVYLSLIKLNCDGTYKKSVDFVVCGGLLWRLVHVILWMFKCVVCTQEWIWLKEEE